MKSSKLMEALQLSAFLLDADNAGYLGLEEGQAVQKAKLDFGWICDDIALRALKAVTNPASAKATVKGELLRMHSEFSDVWPSLDEPALAHLQNSIFDAVDREGAKKEWQRQLSWLVHLLPMLLRWVIWLWVAGIAVMAALHFLAK